jgi:lantibiotic modifying enzyme
MDELTRIANYLILHGRYQNNPGLFRGKAGTMLTMFLFSQKTGISLYRDFAEDLLEDIQNQLFDILPLGMKDGLTGIAYSMSYLANNNILSFDQNEILCDFDSKIMNSDPRRITDYSFENGALGIWAYINERLKSTQKLTSLDGMFIMELEDSLHKKGILCDDIKLIDQLLQPTFAIYEYEKQRLDIDGGAAYYLLKHSLNHD